MMREFMQIVENADPILYHGTSAPITEPFRLGVPETNFHE